MDVSTKNQIVKWCGRTVISLGSVLLGLLGIHIWDKACDKATAEDRLVGEKNFEKVFYYIKDEALPTTIETAKKGYEENHK